MKPPAYIPIIMNDHIRLCGDLSILNSKLKIEPVECGYSGIKFTTETKSHFENIDLLEKLMMLNESGVLFGEDHTQLYSPAAFMKELQSKGILKAGFNSIYWKGSDNWNIRENLAEPEVGLYGENAC